MSPRQFLGSLLVFLVVMAGGAVFLFAQFQSSTASERDAAVASFQQRAEKVANRIATQYGAPDPDATGGGAADASAHAETYALYESLFALVKERLNENAAWHRVVDERLLFKPWRTLSEEQLGLLKETPLANQDLLETIRDVAARGGPVCPLDFSKGFDMELLHLAPLRQCARLLCANAILKAMEGSYTEAAEDILAGMKLADALADEPVLISQLVRIGGHAIMNGGVQAAFGEGELPPDLARRIVDYAAEADHRQSFADSIAGDGLLSIHTVKEMGLQWLLDDEDSYPLGYADWLYNSPFWAPWRNLDQKALAQMLERLFDAAELVFYEAQPVLEEMGQAVERLPATRVNTRSLLPTLIRAPTAQARHEAMLDLLQMGLLLEVFCMENGRYPDTLEAIAPQLGGAVPLEPFTGQPYHYSSTGDRFLLYSIGQNLQDDGGVHDYREGDIVWRGET